MRYADFVTFTYISLSAQRLRTALTALGIAVGIAAVILLTSIGEGLHRFVIAEFTQFGTNIITVTPGRVQTHGASLGAVNTVRPLSIDDALALRRAPYVQLTDPIVQGNAEVVYAGKSRRERDPCGAPAAAAECCGRHQPAHDVQRTEARETLLPLQAMPTQ